MFDFRSDPDLDSDPVRDPEADPQIRGSGSESASKMKWIRNTGFRTDSSIEELRNGTYC